LKLKIAIILVGISLFSSILYGTDKITSENPSDAASIKIGLSSIDSSSCKICSEGGIFYDSGCKRCIQDGVVLTAHVANDRFYGLGWSNDDGMYYGDEMCEGSKNFPNANTNENDTYWIEIIKDEFNKHYRNTKIDKSSEKIEYNISFLSKLVNYYKKIKVKNISQEINNLITFIESLKSGTRLIKLYC